MYVRSQDLPPAYVINGGFYLIAPENLRKTRAFINEDTMPLVFDEPREAIDIDSEWDWRMAEMICAMADTIAR
jgi:N-acylneuraminate cytidylyltransferase